MNPNLYAESSNGKNEGEDASNHIIHKAAFFWGGGWRVLNIGIVEGDGLTSIHPATNPLLPKGLPSACAPFLDAFILFVKVI